ncbi:hypothetical protein ACFL35_21215 [Candidatus Riflebacteria bacterium]
MGINGRTVGRWEAGGYVPDPVLRKVLRCCLWGLLSILQASGLVYLLPAFYNNLTKRLIKADVPDKNLF